MYSGLLLLLLVTRYPASGAGDDFALLFLHPWSDWCGWCHRHRSRRTALPRAWRLYFRSDSAAEFMAMTCWPRSMINAMDARMPIMPITTRSSMRLKPFDLSSSRNCVRYKACPMNISPFSKSPSAILIVEDVGGRLTGLRFESSSHVAEEVKYIG